MLISANLSTSLPIFLTLLLDNLRPTTIIILAIEYYTYDKRLIQQLATALLIASQHMRSQPSLVWFTREEWRPTNEIDEWHIKQSKLITSRAKILCVHVHSDNDAGLIIQPYNNHQRLFGSFPQLILLPWSLWQTDFHRFEVHQYMPSALVAVYRSDEAFRIVSFCRGANCQMQTAKDELVGIRRMPICHLDYIYEILLRRDDPELQLLRVLEWHWQRCFHLKVLDTFEFQIRPDVLHHKCGFLIDSNISELTSDNVPIHTSMINNILFPICAHVRLELSIAQSEAASAAEVPWMRRQYIMLVPNWWHWRPALSAAQMNRRTTQAALAVAASLLCWLALLMLRMRGSRPETRWQLGLEMWAQMLAVASSPAAVPEATARNRVQIFAGIATTVLGMWNAMTLTGVLFELRISAAEWRPVFGTLDDVCGVSVKLYSLDRRFSAIAGAWMDSMGIAYDPWISWKTISIRRIQNQCIFVLADGTEDWLEFASDVHEGNGSRVHRLIRDPRLLFPLEISIYPEHLRNELHEFGQRMNEAGLAGHLCGIKSHRQQVHAMVASGTWFADDCRMENSEPDQLVTFLQVYAGLLVATTAVWFTELIASGTTHTIYQCYN